MSANACALFAATYPERCDRLAPHRLSYLVARGAPGKVLVSGTVKDLVAGSGFSCEDFGERELRGVPGVWRLYVLTPA